MEAAVLWPLASLLVIPLYLGVITLLARGRKWALVLVPGAVCLMLGSWTAAVLLGRQPATTAETVLGSAMGLAGAVLWAGSAARIFFVPGQTTSRPEVLVTAGVYGVVRHPMYTGAALMVSGFAVGFGARLVFLETPLLWALVALGGLYEERTRLAPTFGQAFERYRASTPFLLPLWAWLAWLVVYGWVAAGAFAAAGVSSVVSI